MNNSTQLLSDDDILHLASLFGVGTLPVLSGSYQSQIPEGERLAQFARAIESALLSKLRAPVADELPHWEEVSAKLERDETLTPLELFIFDNEPAGDEDTWRDQLAAALASAPVGGEAHPPTRHCMCEDCAPSFSDAAPQASEAEQTIIAAFLERSGQWLTNDAITKAARNAALEEAAVACKETSMMNVDSYCGATASMCADRIRALKSQSAALSAQPGAQRTGGSE
ncbi:hypothetical protein [Achromobacter arsenitoxydans]|uniref:Uncharacterized protein n=1 Tax=Achromobacter arsenitoxydans SY8 TaxID=477184 RepID=H0F736_9BURK|nr:hypothetical protein [Achromobacter arsenitoxydans]EHK65950.1 hypothetical protein KYC_12513 [Achromobacter arsenitoxydans SY8]